MAFSKLKVVNGKSGTKPPKREKTEAEEIATRHFRSELRDEAAEEYLQGVFEELVQARETGDRTAKFRSSRFPYCPVIDLEGMFDGSHEFEPGYVPEFYTKSGTAHHENIQYWMPKLKRHGNSVWGDWGCTNRECPDWNKAFEQTGDLSHKGVGWVSWAKGVRKTDKTSKQRKNRLKSGLRPHKCPSCGGTKFKYLEIVFTREHGVPGHVDKVLFVGGKIIILDYKTTTFRRFEGEWEGHLPYLSNVAQISNYCVMFERKYGVRPRSWVLVYVPRERPENNGYYGRGKGPIFLPLSQQWTDRLRKKAIRRLDRASKGRVAVEKLLNHIDTANVPMKKKEAVVRDELVEKIASLRPCRKPLEYETYMGGKFTYSDGCPHFNSGKCAIADAAPIRITNRVKYLAEHIVNEEGHPAMEFVRPAANQS